MANGSATYLNPWYQPNDNRYGPAVYHTRTEPVEYRGYLIYNRISSVWDVVKDGTCVTQMAGPRGARDAIDRLLEVRT